MTVAMDWLNRAYLDRDVVHRRAISDHPVADRHTGGGVGIDLLPGGATGVDAHGQALECRIRHQALVDVEQDRISQLVRDRPTGDHTDADDQAPVQPAEADATRAFRVDRGFAGWFDHQRR